jgi:transposase
MKTHTRFIAKLKKKEKNALNNFVNNSSSSRIRNRAHAVLLSSEGKNTTELTEIFGVHYQTISAWLDRWDNEGIQGMTDKSRSGAPSRLTDSEKKIVLKLLVKHPHSPKLVLTEVTRKLGKTISQWILRQIAKSANMSWKRMRKSLKSKQDKKKFQTAKREIKKLAKQHQEGEIDLVFF